MHGNTEQYQRFKETGISIIEVMISLIILSAGLLAVSKFQAQLFQSSAVATQRSETQALAQQVIDFYRASSKTTLDAIVAKCPISGTSACTGAWLSPSTGTPVPQTIAGNSYITSWQMSKTETSSTAATQKFIYRIEVTVSWESAQGAQTHMAYALIMPNA